MTRENKLVMVIGFGLLLFVGILVSDHLSARDAQIADPATIVSYESKALPGAIDEPVRDFGDMPERLRDEPATVDGRPVVQRPIEDPMTRPDAFRSEPTALQPEPPAARPTMTERTHTIAKGDNPEKIALKYYGTRSLASKLAEYNGIDPTKLRIGQTLRIPDMAVLDPKAAARTESPAVVRDGEAPRGEARASEPRRETPKPAPIAKGRTVTVQNGDNLWKIATRAFGKGSNANVQRIRDLNPGLNEKNLKIGSQIRIAAE